MFVFLCLCLQNAEGLPWRVQLYTKDVDFARRLRTVTESRQGHARQEKDENIHRQTSQWGAGSWVSLNVCLLVWYWFASDGNFAQGNVGYVLLLKKASCHRVRNPGFQFIPSSWISAGNLPGQCFVGVYGFLKVCAARGIGYGDLICFILLSVFVVVVSVNLRDWILSQPPLNRPEGLFVGLFTCLIFLVYLSILSVSSSLPFHPSLFFIVWIQPHLQKEKFLFNNKCYIHLWKHTSKKTSLCSCVCICMLDAGAMCT